MSSYRNIREPPTWSCCKCRRQSPGGEKGKAERADPTEGPGLLWWEAISWSVWEFRHWRKTIVTLRQGWPSSVNFSRTWLELASGSTIAVGPGACVHGLKLPYGPIWPGSRSLELWNSLPIAQAGHGAHKHLPLMGTPELCGFTADFLSGYFRAMCVVANSVGTEHHEFLCFRSLSQGPTNVRSIPTESFTHVMEIGAKMGKCPAILFLPHELTYIWKYMYLQARCGLVCHF